MTSDRLSRVSVVLGVLAAAVPAFLLVTDPATDTTPAVILSGQVLLGSVLALVSVVLRWRALWTSIGAGLVWLAVLPLLVGYVFIPSAVLLTVSAATRSVRASARVRCGGG